MKILHVIDSGGLYGAEKILLDLVKEQAKKGLKPEIASIGEKSIPEKPLEKEAREAGLPLSIFRMRPGPNLLGAMNIRNYAVRNGFDIYHSHGYKGNILLGYMPFVLRQLPVIATLHGYTGTGKGLSKIHLYEWLDRLVLRRLDAVVLVSGRMLDHPKLMGIKNINYQVIENGIDLQPIKKSAGNLQSAKVTDFCKNGFIVGAVGRLSKEKGHEFLIDAFGRIVQNIAEAKLLILGEGPMRQSLEQKVSEQGLNNRVLMPGYVGNASQFMTFFDVFVLSSMTEGLPVTLLEAMRAEKPVVATNVGAMTDFVQHGKNGLLVNPADAGSLAKAVEQIFHDNNLRMLSDKTNADLLKKFSSDRMASDYQRLYQEILKKRNQ
ncbi:MAG: glycosyltransferase [Thermodesulfobacteriota bacterium]|nr:glycosyltransferase [Thermodesulfobacteriota bacterium]